MLASVYVATALLLGASLTVGRALFAVLGARERTWLEPAAGFALLIVVARLAIRLPGRATTSLLALAALVVLAGVILAATRPLAVRSPGAGVVTVAVVLLVLAAASIPFLASDRVGLLGVGRQSDLQAHVYAADYLTHHVGFPPDAIGNGYPLGPHALVASVARLTGGGTEATFLGLILAIPALVAWTALAALADVAPGRRVLAAALVGLPYLAASFLAEGTFKETAEGLYLLAFALGLRELALRRVPLNAVVAALIAIAGASVYTYSYPGLAWPAVALALWALFELLGGWRPAIRLRRPSRRAALLIAAGIAALVAIAIPEAHRIADFRHTVSLVEETKGRLRAPISPAQALGLWPAGNFRIDPADAALATAMALAALGALVFGLLWWIARRELAVPGALAGAVLIYLEARHRSGLYIEAKALAVMAPLPMLVALRALLTRAGPLRLLAATVICVGAAASSFMALRAAPVGPAAHGEELAHLRPLLSGKRVLFLGLDRFSQHELRGAYVRQGNLLASLHSRPYKRWTPERALDFDSVPYKRLDRFDLVVATSAGFNSAPPPNFRRVAATRDFVLFKREGPTAPRATLDEQALIGTRFDCSKPVIRALSRRRGVAAVTDPPVVGVKAGWRGGPYFAAGGSAAQQLDLSRGDWRLSLQYNSPVPLVVEVSDGFGEKPRARFFLPPSLDGKVPYFEGAGPFWPAGQWRVRNSLVLTSEPPIGESVPVVTIRAPRLNWLQRLLGVRRRVALGQLAATSAKPERLVALNKACGRFVDWYRTG